MSDTRFYRRRFLNKRGHHAGAYVIASVALDRWPDSEYCVDAFIDLALEGAVDDADLR